MAQNTFQTGMFPIEFKTCIVVVEFFGQPVGKSVAPFTIIFSRFFKLFEMNVFVAVFTVPGQVGKLLFHHSIGFPEVATAAVHLRMFPQKLKIGFIVIKQNFIPHPNRVTGFAIRFRHVFFR